MGSTDNKPVVRFATGLDADDWLKEDIQVATPENDPNVYDPRRSRRHNVFSMPSGGMRRDLAGIDRDRSGGTYPAPRMPPRKAEKFMCPPIGGMQVPFDECELQEENPLCYEETEEPEEEPEVEICGSKRCSGEGGLRNQHMSMPSNLVLTKPTPENPPIAVYPGPRPRTLKRRLLDDMKNVCATYESFKANRSDLISLGEATDLKESVRCLETDVAQIENIRDALKAVNEAVCAELKVSAGFAGSKYGSAGMAARQILVSQRRRLTEVRQERLDQVRSAVDSLMASDKLTEEAFEASKLLQRCPEDCAEEQRRTSLALTLDLLKIADDSFCKAVMSIDWVLASFCSKEAVVGNIVRAIGQFIDTADEHNPRLNQMLKLTGSANALELTSMLDGEKAKLLKALRRSRACLLEARDKFVCKFQPIPPIKLYKSDYKRGSSARPSSVCPSGNRKTSTCLAAEPEIRCVRREDMNDILEPKTVRNIKRMGMV
jgi:ElaB/YqjD/DUF883 family membrane-anchored ribosome-binding protein